MPNNVLPPSLINPLGTALMNVYPAANNPSNRNQNYILTFERKIPRYGHAAKVDWNVGDSTRAYIRYTNDDGAEQNRNTGSTGGNLPGATIQRPRPDRGLAANVTHMFCTNLVMESLFSWSYDKVQWIAVDPESLTKAKNGLSGLPTVFKAANDTIPGVNVGNVYPSYNFNRVPAYAIAHEFQFSTSFAWTRGTHLVKRGGQYLRNTKDEIDSTNNKGTFDFGTTASAIGANYAPANMLTGALASFTQIERVAHKNSLYADYHIFIQDTWKATRKLTFDFGLRAYHVPAQRQVNPKDTPDAVFLPSRWDPARAPRYYVPDPT